MGAREPWREAYRPASGAVTTIISVIGRNRSPAWNARVPRRYGLCMYRLRKKNVANMPSETENATRLPAENAGIRKNGSGIMACGLRGSQKRKPATSAAPPNNVAGSTDRSNPLVRFDQRVGEREERAAAQRQAGEVQLAGLVGP